MGISPPHPTRKSRWVSPSPPTRKSRWVLPSYPQPEGQGGYCPPPRHKLPTCPPTHNKNAKVSFAPQFLPEDQSQYKLWSWTFPKKANRFILYVFVLQLRKRLFGHKRTRSDPELDDLVAPVVNGQSNGSANSEQKQVRHPPLHSQLNSISCVR